MTSEWVGYAGGPAARPRPIWERLATGRGMPIRTRFALFGAGIVAATVIVFAVTVYVAVQHNLTASQDTTLVRRGNEIAQQLESRGRAFLGTPGESPFPPDIATSTIPFAEFLDQSGAPLQAFGTVHQMMPSIPPSALKNPRPQTVDLQDVPARIYVRPVTLADGSLAGYVVVGQSIAAVAEQLAGLRLFLIAGILLSLLLALVASWFVAGQAVRPLESMARTAEEIGETRDLSRRLPQQESSNDEVARLRDSFNLMLQRLQDAYLRLENALDAQRRFVADASHELRTPLTTIRSNAGLIAQRQDLSPADQQEAANDILIESERMSRMVHDLLTLARADAGYHLEREPLELTPILQEVSRQIRPLSGERSIELAANGPGLVKGNADALKQLVLIFVDNAVKHTRPDGRIRIELTQIDGSVVLTVADNGPGIPASEIDRIFERFYRADPSRSGEGAGLGLAIAKWIVREHQGTVSAANRSEGGAIFTVRLPELRPSEQADRADAA